MNIKNNAEENIVVSICCLAYNHEAFISKCLDGFLMQKTLFAFEVLVNDDASIDRTSKIIKEYQNKYPKIVKPVFQTVNKFSVEGGGMNIRYNFPRAKGKYIAMCEGDDYWTDPLKLQKQVDFLEENEEYNICFHRSYMLKDASLVLHEIPIPFDNTPFYYIELLRHFNFMLTASVVFRKPHKNIMPNWLSKMPFGDLALYKIVGQDKKIGCINEIMSVYRIHEKGIWSLLKPIEAKIQYLDFYKKVYFYLSQEEKIIVSDKIKKNLFQVSKLKYPKNAIMNKMYYYYKLMILNKYMNTNLGSTIC